MIPFFVGAKNRQNHRNQFLIVGIGVFQVVALLYTAAGRFSLLDELIYSDLVALLYAQYVCSL